MPPTSLDCGNKSNTASSVFNTPQMERAPKHTDWCHLGTFWDKTLRLLKMAREALIYLSLAMHREEDLRKETSENGS